MPSLLSIPVQICAENAQYLTLQAVETFDDCPQCAAGNGCGQNIWFRGLMGKKPFQVPRPAHLPSGARFLELQLPQHILTLLSLLLYGLPLLAFIITLWLSQSQAAYWQFLLALAALFLSLRLGKNLQHQLLLRHLQIHQAPSTTKPSPLRFSP